jgi:hypothetical protein
MQNLVTLLNKRALFALALLSSLSHLATGQMTDTTGIANAKDTVYIDRYYQQPKGNWRHEVAGQVVRSGGFNGLQADYRVFRKSRGIALSLMAYEVPYDSKKYFLGRITNQVNEVRADTTTYGPYRSWKGNWKTVDGTSIGLSPGKVSKAFYGLKIGIPFIFKTPNPDVRVSLSPYLGLARHQFYAINDTAYAQNSIFTVINVGTAPYYSMRIEESYREVIEKREMTIDKELVASLSYEVTMLYQITHRLGWQIGFTGVMQKEGANSNLPMAMLQSTYFSVQSGLYFRINPGPRPAKSKPREIIKL